MIKIPSDITMIVLDMDGTIYRKQRMVRYMLRKQWRHFPKLIAERRWRKAQRKALRTGGDMPQMPVSEEWYRQSYLPSMVEVIREHYTPQAWLQPLLEQCKHRNIPVIILSDYEAVTDKLQALGLDASAFAAVLATGEMGTIKPDKRLGERVQQALHAETIDWRHVLFVGDRPDTDGLLAQALGAQFIQV